MTNDTIKAEEVWIGEIPDTDLIFVKDHDAFGCGYHFYAEQKFNELKEENQRYREALQGVLPYMEAAEKAGLVGDEGCHWPVELVRTALKTEANEKS